LCVIWLRRGSLFGFDPEVLLCFELWLKQLRELQGARVDGSHAEHQHRKLPDAFG